eukprot:SAG31_NODE_32876_length_350_cov_1.605578_1_plen_26_part_01
MGSDELEIDDQRCGYHHGGNLDKLSC